MPSKSEKQRKFMGLELARLRAGEKTDTGMSEQQLRDFARKSIVKFLEDYEQSGLPGPKRVS